MADPALSGEIVSYLIIQTPVMSVTQTTTNLLYTLQLEARANAIFSPNPFDAYANSLFRRAQLPAGVTSNPLPGTTAGVNYDPHLKVGSSNLRNTIKEIAKKAGKKLLHEGVPALLSRVAPMLLMAQEPEEKEAMVDIASARSELRILVQRLEFFPPGNAWAADVLRSQCVAALQTMENQDYTLPYDKFWEPFR